MEHTSCQPAVIASKTEQEGLHVLTRTLSCLGYSRVERTRMLILEMLSRSCMLVFLLLSRP